MTIRQMFEWAKKNGAEDIPLCFVDEYVGVCDVHKIYLANNEQKEERRKYTGENTDFVVIDGNCCLC